MSGARSVFEFSIHGLVAGRVVGPAWLVAPVAHELGYHRVELGAKVPDLEVELELGRAGGDELEPGAWRGRHLTARWTVQATPAGPGPARLRFRGDLSSRFIVSKWIVEPAIRALAEVAGAAMVHAAGLSDGERAMIVAGPGGSGKTTWALRWLGAGRPYLSDDFSILRGGEVLPYVTPLRIGARNLFTNRVLDRMPLADKLEVVVRSALRAASGGRLKLYKKALIQRAAPGVAISGPARLAGAIWLEAAAEPARSRRLSPAAAAALIAAGDRAEAHGFNAAALVSAAPDGPLTPDRFWRSQQDSLTGLLEGLPCFSLPPRLLPPDSALASIPDLLAWLEARAG